MICKAESAKEIIEMFNNKGVALWQENGKLRYRAAAGTLTQEDMEFLKSNKEKILEFLSHNTGLLEIVPNEEERFEPFPLTDVQAAYLLGRGRVFEYGGTSCHIYLEVNYKELDYGRVQIIWELLISRHEMLRAVISENGCQQVLKETPDFVIPYMDERECGGEGIKEYLKNIREDMGYHFYEINKWPMFGIALTKLSDKTIMHLSIEFLIADWTSIWLLISEFEELYFGEDSALPDLKLTFRDYILAERKIRDGAGYERDRQYWLKRLETMPVAPELPVINNSNNEARFKRHFFKLNEDNWQQIRKTARNNSITPSVVIMAAYAAILERWSRNSDFCINLTILNRLPIHEQVYDIVGDFTSIDILEVNWDNTATLLENIKKINQRLFEDLDHKLFSGVEVIREISKKRSRRDSMMPFVFTSAIGLTEAGNRGKLRGNFEGSGISQTPQLFIDCQAIDSLGGLQINWDVREGVFEDIVIEDMFNAFQELLMQMASEQTSWNKKNVVALPQSCRQIIASSNSTNRNYPECFLHSKILEQILRNPEKTAAIDPDRKLTYKMLSRLAAAAAGELQKLGCKAGESVGIIMRKCCWQVPAVLGILGCNASYVPISKKQPFRRRNMILEKADINFILKLSDEVLEALPEGIQTIDIDCLEPSASDIEITSNDTGTRAYTIFTSGTTGEPKGVSITHRAAVNTISDINRRFEITGEDKVLSLAQLDFDLSVYDLFGILSEGGTIVYPDADRQTDPSYLAELMQSQGISVWNSVPALLQMLVNYLNSENKKTFAFNKLRVVLLSGDWIPVGLPDEFAKYASKAAIISLGGATEASIWSIFYQYLKREKNWRSIPYGKPLDNQNFYVLDCSLRDCPVFCKGELYIGGKGLAAEYMGDVELTLRKFIDHSEKGRLYRTGDLGRWLPDGNIEFLGREDTQVKIRGHRIELGEIEAALLKFPGVTEAAAVISEGNNGKFITGAVKTEGLQKPPDTGHIKEHLLKYIPQYMLPAEILVLKELPLTSNQKVDRKKLEELGKNLIFGKAAVKKNSNDPLTDQLCEIWNEELGINTMEEQDNFYEAGADSLIMARVSGKIRSIISEKPYETDIAFDELLREMINYPTVRVLAEFINNKAGVFRDNKNTAVSKEETDNTVIKLFNDNRDGLLRILLPAGLGTTDCFRYLVPELVKQQCGTVAGINIADTGSYCALLPEQAVSRLADEYAEKICGLGYKKVQIIGYSLGGLTGVELAGRLLERNIEVKGLVLIDIPPILYKINDEIIIEMLFSAMLGLSLEQAGFDLAEEKEIMQAVKSVYDNANKVVPENAVLKIGGNEAFERVRDMFQKISLLEQAERLKRYAAAVKKHTGKDMPEEMLASLFKVFRQSLRAANFQPAPYMGDIVFLAAHEKFEMFPGDEETVREFWEDICLGDLKTIEIPGNHFSCIEEHKNALRVAELLRINTEEGYE